MSKADTVAFEYAKENGTLGLDYNQIYDAVKHGYHQAEKDLELTWKDIKMIYRLVGVVADNLGFKAINTNIYEEALKRFRDFKERKEKCR